MVVDDPLSSTRLLDGDALGIEMDDFEKNRIPINEVVGDGLWGDMHHDARDMQRLGKKQQFKVSDSRESRMPVLELTVDAEKLQLPLHTGVCVDLHGNVGIRPGV